MRKEVVWNLKTHRENKEGETMSKRITRRDFLRLSAVGATGAILAACAPATPQIVEVEKEVPVEKEVVRTVVVEKEVVVTKVAKPAEIVWTSWATDTFGMFRCEEQVALFREKHPEIVVQIRNVGKGYRERLLTSLAGGAGPDVYRICGGDELPFWAEGQCELLDPWLEKQTDSWFWTDDPIKEIYDGHRIRGQLWFLPMALDIQAFNINKTLFKESGVPLPPMSYKAPEYKEAWTYDKYLETAIALTKYAPDGTPIQFGTNVSKHYWLHNIIVSKTGHFWMSEDGSKWLGADPDVTEAIQWLADVRLVHKAAPTPEQAKGGAFDYVAGRLALEWKYCGWLCYGEKEVGDRFDWDVAPLPHWGDGNPGLVHEPCVWVMNPHSKDKDATWTFFHWLCGPEGQRVPVKLAWSAPIHRSNAPFYGEKIPAEKNKGLLLESLEIGSNWYPWLKNPKFYEVWELTMGPALDEVFIGTKTAAEAMAEIKPECEKLLLEGMKIWEKT